MMYGFQAYGRGRPRTELFWQKRLKHVKYRRQNAPGEGSRPLKRRRAIRVLPTLFTLGNLLCGFASLHYASKAPADTQVVSNFAIAGYFIFAAMLFDVFDGFMARLARATSDFGAELDSLADMVSFGVAPAFLTLHLIQHMLASSMPVGGKAPYEFLGPNADDTIGRLFWIIGAVYVCCTGLRLARFNVMNKHDAESHQAFRGMPSPAAAAVVASSIIFFEALCLPPEKHQLPFNVSREVTEMLKGLFPYVMPWVLLSAALLMVSRFGYAHLVNRFLRGRKRFNYIVLLVLVLALLMWQPQITALLGIYVYALSGPAVTAWRRLFKKSRPPGTATAVESGRT